MIELFKESLVGQYQAALEMLGECVTRCPPENWEGYVVNFPFWYVAYHALYYTDMYLSPNEAAFQAPGFHREDEEIFGRVNWPPRQPLVAEFPYSQDVISGYLQHCQDQVAPAVAAETEESLAGPCGFWWYKIPRAEFHLNNVRHVQHHAAQLSAQLRKSAGIDIRWVGSGLAR